LLHEGKTILATTLGQHVLGRFDAFDADDTARARQVAWWKNVVMPDSEFDATAYIRFMSDMVSTGDEVEAMRLAAQRAGKEIPPESWQWSPNTRSASRRVPEG
jgi:hypothetical protein